MGVTSTEKSANHSSLSWKGAMLDILTTNCHTRFVFLESAVWIRKIEWYSLMTHMFSNQMQSQSPKMLNLLVKNLCKKKCGATDSATFQNVFLYMSTKHVLCFSFFQVIKAGILGFQDSITRRQIFNKVKYH